MEDSGYHALPEALQTRLRKRFETAIELQKLNSQRRGDKKKAHDIYTHFKQAVKRQQSVEAEIWSKGTLIGVEEAKDTKYIAHSETPKVEDETPIKIEKKTNVSDTSYRACMPETKQFMILFQKLRFMSSSLAPFLNQVVGMIYLVSKDYGVCADHVLHQLETGLGLSEQTAFDTLKAFEEVSSERDYFAEEVQSLAKVVKALTSENESAMEAGLSIELGEGNEDQVFEEEGDEFSNDALAAEQSQGLTTHNKISVHAPRGQRGTINTNKAKSGIGHVEGAKMLTKRTRDIVSAFMASTDELSQRAKRRHAHEEKQEKEAHYARIRQAREEFLAQGQHNAKIVQHRDFKAVKRGAKGFDYRERRRKEMEAKKRESESMATFNEYSSDRGDEHDRSEAALAVVMLEDQVRVLNSQLEVARWHALTPQEQRRIEEEKEQKFEEMRLRVERAQAMSNVKMTVITLFRNFVTRWRRNKVRRKVAALRIVTWYRFHKFIQRVKLRIKTKMTSEFLAVVCYKHVVLPRRRFHAAVRMVQRFWRRLRFQFVMKSMFKRIVTAALEKSASAVKTRLDPVRAQLDFLEKHLLALSPFNTFNAMEERLNELRNSTEAASNVSWAEVSPLLYGKKHYTTSKVCNEARMSRHRDALWMTVQDIWSDAASLKKRLLLLHNRTNTLRIATRSATRLQYLTDILSGSVRTEMASKELSIDSNLLSPMHRNAFESKSNSIVPNSNDLDSKDEDNSATIPHPYEDKDTMTLPPQNPKGLRKIDGPSRAQPTTTNRKQHHVYLKKVEHREELYEPTPPSTAGSSAGDTRIVRGRKVRAPGVSTVKITTSPRASSALSDPTGVRDMVNGEDGEDDDAVAPRGVRYRLMLDHGAKVEKEVLLAKLIRLNRVFSSNLQSHIDKQSDMEVKNRERMFVTNNFFKRKVVTRPPGPPPMFGGGITKETEEGEEKTAKYMLIGDQLLHPESICEVKFTISRGIPETARTTKRDLRMWIEFSFHLCSRIPTLLRAYGLFPTTWHPSDPLGSAHVGAIAPLGYIPDLSCPLPDEVLQCYLLVGSGRSPTTFPTGRGGLNLFSKHELLSSARLAIPPKESEKSIVAATLLDSSRTEAIHHASELCISGLLNLPSGGEISVVPSPSQLLCLAADDFAAESDAQKLLTKLVLSLSAGDMSMFRRDAGSIALESSIQLLAFFAYLSTHHPPEFSVWLTNMEGRLTTHPMERRKIVGLDEITSSPQSDAGAFLVFFSHAISASLEIAPATVDDPHLISVDQALRWVQTLFGLEHGEVRSSSSLLHLLSMRAQHPESVWGEDKDFFTAVSHVLSLVGVEVNRIPFTAPQVKKNHDVISSTNYDRAVDYKCTTKRTFDPNSEPQAHARPAHRSTMCVATLEYDLQVERSVVKDPIYNVVEGSHHDQEGLRRALDELHLDSLSLDDSLNMTCSPERRHEQGLSSHVMGLTARRAALFSDLNDEFERHGLLLPASHRKKKGPVQLHDTKIECIDEFGEVHTFNTQDYASFEEELDFVNYSANARQKGKADREKNNEPRLVISDAKLYTEKCRATRSISKEEVSSVGVKESSAKLQASHGKCEVEHLSLFDAQQKLQEKRKRATAKKREGGHVIAKNEIVNIEGGDSPGEEGLGVRVGVEARKREEVQLDETLTYTNSKTELASVSVKVGESVKHEDYFLRNAQVDRFAVALCLLPMHLEQRRRVQRMIWLNEAWRSADGHIVGAISKLKFTEVVAMLEKGSSSKLKDGAANEAWTSALRRQDALMNVNDVMQFPSFCAAIESLDIEM